VTAPPSPFENEVMAMQMVEGTAGLRKGMWELREALVRDGWGESVADQIIAAPFSGLLSAVLMHGLAEAQLRQAAEEA
jgi:hypothetical protein